MGRLLRYPFHRRPGTRRLQPRLFHALRFPAAFVLFAAIAATLVLPHRAGSQSSCCAGGPTSQNCNVIMIADDSLAACPAGDSVSFVHSPLHPHPAWLRIRVHYEDNSCNFRVHVPPESIWVTYATLSGNLVLNDKGSKVFADDYTDAFGDTWITLKSFSGCGTIRCSLFVSTKFSGFVDRVVRTIDPDADGRVELVESATCDANYDGMNNDGSLRVPHEHDWRRNALHGTLVKRTTFCDTCSPGLPNTLGTGDVGWSASGRRLVFSINNSAGVCKIFDAPSDLEGGNALRQLSFSTAPTDSHDYDPTWSPLGDHIFYWRLDRVIHRKGIPGLATDTSDVAIYGEATLNCCGTVSPDGRHIAFSRLASGRWGVWTITASGDSLRQVTTGNNRDWYPRWSPDGQSLIFDRRTLTNPAVRSLYTVPAFTNPPPEPTQFYTSPSLFSGLPSYAEDGRVVIAGVGQAESTLTSRTLDAAAPSGFRPIENYAQHTYGFNFPKLSPDGTRLAMAAKDPIVPGAVGPQVWAARRNMNLPPNFTVIGGQTVADSTARVYFTMLQGHAYSFTVNASDPADPVSDPLTYAAHYLRAGMAFDTSTRTFSWTPPAGTAGQTFHVKFQVTTPSGGADGILAVISVTQNLEAMGSRSRMAPLSVSVALNGDGLVRFDFQNAAAKGVQVTVFDLAGRRLTQLEGRGKDALWWSGKESSGRQVPNGVYFYRLRTGGTTLYGRLVYLR